MLAVAVSVAVACKPIPQRDSLTVPVNACPDHACEAYAPPSPPATCMAGVCVASMTGLGEFVLLVALPEDSYLAPDRTFASRFADLLNTATMPTSCKCAPSCVCLPGPAYHVMNGKYTIQPSDAIDVGFALGVAATLPVHVTYRALWPLESPSASMPEGGLIAGDAVGAGLPIYPVEAQPVQRPFGIPGPGQSLELGFETYLQPGMTYERTIAPDPPFDRAFPPDVNTINEPQVSGEDVPIALDHTSKLTAGVTYPTFDLVRTDGTLDGWTVYLRDATTKRPLSPIRPLVGSTACAVLLPTSHHPSSSDALTNVQLVIAPPPGAAIPNEVFTPPGLVRQVYALLLMPELKLQGNVVWSDRTPAPAELVFEATAIYAARPPSVPNPCDGGAAGNADQDGGIEFTLNTENFEYVAHVNLQPDPKTGTSTYSVNLPRGVYRVILRPHDAPNAEAPPGAAHQVTIFDGFNTQLDGGAPPLTVGPATVVTGKASVADGRRLSGAMVEAVPVRCPKSMVVDGGFTSHDSIECLPRAQQTTTDADGSFSLALDPGGYVLRIEPADGSRLPWVIERISEPPPPQLAVTIPAPVHQQLRLADPVGNAIAKAIVRFFTMPAPGSQAIEVWSAITDVDGRFDLYLDPACAAGRCPLPIP
jgi:hypothetical protein